MTLRIPPGIRFRDRWGANHMTLDVTLAVESLSSFLARPARSIMASWDARPPDPEAMAVALRRRAEARTQSPFSVIVSETPLSRYGYAVVPGPLTARAALSEMATVAGMADAGMDLRTFSVLATWHEAGHVIEPAPGGRAGDAYSGMLAERWCDALGAAAALAITGDVASVLAWARLREAVARRRQATGGTDWMLHDVADVTRAVAGSWDCKVGWDGPAGPLALASAVASTGIPSPLRFREIWPAATACES